MMDFPFVQVVPSKVKADGTLRIYGALLDQLAAMKPGFSVELDLTQMRFASLIALLALAGCGAPEVKVSQPPPPPPPAVTVFIGDSITYGWKLSELVLGSLNKGIGGQRTWEMAARFDTDVLAHHPGVVVILGGTNDIFSDPAASPQYVWKMVGEALATGARVIVGTIPPGDNWASSSVIKTLDQGHAAISAWNAQVRSGAGALGYEVADYYPAMVLPDGSQNVVLFNADRIHPNQAGYDAMWGVLGPLL